jgi:hypothetical protein
LCYSVPMRPSAGTIAIIAAALILLLAAGAMVGLIVLIAMPPLLDSLHGLPTNIWWFMYRVQAQGSSAAPVWRVAAAIAASILAVPAILRLGAVQRNASSPIIVFLSLFLVTIALECLRAGTAILFSTDGSIALSILLTKVIYWGRFVGLLALLLAALYCLDLTYSRVMVLTGVVLLVSFAMAAYIPIDRTTFLAQLTWKLGDEQSVWFLNLALGVLAALVGVTAGITRKRPLTRGMAIAIVLFIAARELEFFALQPLPLAAGLSLQAVGSLLSIRAVGSVEE